MVDVPAGPFTMGRDDGPPDERPAHTVVVGPYKIDRYPVTNAQFTVFLEESGHTNSRGERLFDHDDPDARVRQYGDRWLPDPGYHDHPVIEVSWAGARDYCQSRGKRLPTEAEWEKAARGTDGRLYPWGNEAPTPARAQYGAGWNQTAPVEAHPSGASPYGVQGLAGNAWEWVSSQYRPYPYRDDDGRESTAAGPVRVTRGGGHDSTPERITATHRGQGLSRNPRSGHHNIGFRCAKSVTGRKSP